MTPVLMGTWDKDTYGLLNMMLVWHFVATVEDYNIRANNP
jgi:hypothetical protein